MKYFWPTVAPGIKIHDIVKLDVLAHPETGKPVIMMTIDSTIIYVTANIAEMIGGCATGARLRYEELSNKEKMK